MSSTRVWRMDGATSSFAALDRDLWQYFRQRVQRNDDLARDLTQKTWLSAALFRGESSRRSYLFCVARRVLADWYRKLHRRAKYLELGAGVDEVLDGTPSIDDLIDSRESHLRVQAAIEQLPEPFRAVVDMRMAGLRGEEIAAALSISPNTVRSRASRGMAQLRLMLCEDDTGDGLET